MPEVQKVNGVVKDEATEAWRYRRSDPAGT